MAQSAEQDAIRAADYHSRMRRSVASVVVMVLFASLLLATSKSEPIPQPVDAKTAADAAITEGASSDASSDAAAALPATDAWEEVKVKPAKARLRIPKGASIPADRAGRDETFARSYFRVLMPSGYDVYFAERHGTTAVDIAVDKLAYRSKPKAAVSFLFEADDAVVVHRNDPEPAGSYCEVTACGKLGGKPMCVSNDGARIEGTQVKKLTEAECFAVVAMARSIRDL